MMVSAGDSMVLFSTEKGLRRMYWASFSSSALFSGGTGAPAWTLKPECFQERRTCTRSGGKEFEGDEELEDMDAEEFFQRLEREFGQGVENAIAGEETVRDQGVNMGMEVEVFAEGMEGEDEGGLEGAQSPPPHEPGGWGERTRGDASGAPA